ncbi:MAG: FAD-binding oxidoreductase [Methylocystaceae bacterium]
MGNSDIRQQIQGYEAIRLEAEVCRKYGRDYEAEKGIYARALERLHPQRLHLQIAKIISETPSAKTLRLVSTGDPLPPFQAGQYINLAVEIDGVRTSRAYSISSSPTQTAYYDLTVRRITGGFVSDYLLDQATVGDHLAASGPTGNFYYNPLFHGQDLVFIAGGSGITPFMSMIREVSDSAKMRKIHLIYGSKSADDVIFHQELLACAQANSNFTYSLVISEPPPNYSGLSGLIDAHLLTSLITDLTAPTFYLCGPAALYEFCLPALEALGIPRRRIRREVIGTPANITGQPGWPASVEAGTSFNVKIAGGLIKARTISARAGEPLLVALERHGITVNNSCRSGECSLCRVKLLNGQVFQPVGLPVRQSDIRFGYIHSCMAYPVTDLEVMI